MGSITVYLLKYGKTLLAWSIFIAAAAVFYTALDNSGALAKAAEYESSVISAIAGVASAIPSRVGTVVSAINYSVSESDFGSLLFWVAGFDILESIIAYLIAQINTIMAAVVYVGTTSLVFAGLVWVLRRAQRLVKITSGGDLDVSAVD